MFLSLTVRRNEKCHFYDLPLVDQYLQLLFTDLFAKTSGKTLFWNFMKFFDIPFKMEFSLKTLNANISVTVRASGLQFCVVTRTLILRKNRRVGAVCFGNLIHLSI